MRQKEGVLMKKRSSLETEEEDSAKVGETLLETTRHRNSYSDMDRFFGRHPVHLWREKKYPRNSNDESPMV